MKTSRKCMSDEICNEIAQRIYDGTLPPGERLVELSIAKEFGTSQTPVREALRELEAMRLVQSEPYKGTRVREISAREMAESYSVRAILEQAAAELGAEEIRKDLAPLEAATQRICDGAAAGDIERYAEANLDFHRIIVSAAGNSVLLETWDGLRFESRIRVNLIRQNVPLVDRAAEHEPIVEAFRQADGRKAGALLREHSESFAQAWTDQAEQEASQTAASPIESID